MPACPRKGRAMLTLARPRSQAVFPSAFFRDFERALACTVTTGEKITSSRRRRLKDEIFALPETRSYPLTDAYHARLALTSLLRVAGRHGSDPALARKVLRAVEKRFPEVYLCYMPLVVKVKRAYRVR